MNLFSIKLISLAAATILLFSCSDNQNAPDYDYDNCVALTSVCQRLANQEINKIDFETLGKKSENFRELQRLLILQQHHHDDIQMAQKLLMDGEYDAMLKFIDKIENSGYATSELLELRSLPQALQALQFFRARMPWQDATSLNVGLSWLAPYLPILNRSPSFQFFYQQQLDTLKKLSK